MKYKYDKYWIFLHYLYLEQTLDLEIGIYFSLLIFYRTDTNCLHSPYQNRENPHVRYIIFGLCKIPWVQRSISHGFPRLSVCIPAFLHRVHMAYIVLPYAKRPQTCYVLSAVIRECRIQWGILSENLCVGRNSLNGKPQYHYYQIKKEVEHLSQITGWHSRTPPNIFSVQILSRTMLWWTVVLLEHPNLARFGF